MKNRPASKKVLFISHSEYLQGGAEASLLELIKSARKRGYEPYLLVPQRGDLSEEIKSMGVKYEAVQYFRWGSATTSDLERMTDIKAATKIAHIIRDEKIDCVVTNTLMVPWGALAAAIAGVPHIWIAREFFAHHRNYLKDNYDFIDAFSNLVIANSKSNAEYLKTVAGIKSAKFFYSYVDVSGVRLAKKRDKPRIVCIGIIHPDKNQLEVLRALIELKNQGVNLGQVVFLGRFRQDDYFQEIKALIDQNGLQEIVEFAGFSNDPYANVSPNDILIQPSKHESLGRTITEAMKLGFICVGADVSGTSEAFRLGGGNLYKSGDHKDLAKILKRIIENPKEYQKKAKIAQKKALKNLSEEASHGSFFSELEKVFGKPNPRHELRHLLPQLERPMLNEQLIHDLEARLDEYQRAAERRRKDIENIINSKAWKTATKLRSARMLPKSFVNSFRSKQVIRFIYLDGKQFYGSTVMRGQQLADIARGVVKTNDILYSPLDFNCKNSILFITKWALAALKPETLSILKKNKNILIFDPVDAALPSFTKDYADILVAASKTAYQDYRKQLPSNRIILVNHHVDPRIKLDESRHPQSLHIGYFGEAVNTFVTPRIRKRVDIVQVSTNKQENDWLDKLSDYNLHYAIRQIEQSDNHKPFLKGFTAAYCNSNILIQDSQPEAILWLGRDYPYLLKGKVSEDTVLEKLDYIKDSYGSSEWNRALEKMTEIKEKTSVEAIQQQLIDLFKEARNV